MWNLAFVFFFLHNSFWHVPVERVGLPFWGWKKPAPVHRAPAERGSPSAGDPGHFPEVSVIRGTALCILQLRGFQNPPNPLFYLSKESSGQESWRRCCSSRKWNFILASWNVRNDSRMPSTTLPGIFSLASGLLLKPWKLQKMKIRKETN